jgi:1-aminocyclopropane-1-carboxylate deaminase
MLDSARLNALGITHVVTGVGTGCTFAGLRLAASGNVKLLGISGLKGDWVAKAMATRLQGYSNWLDGNQLLNWQLSCQYHRGGFGRVDDYLLSFIQQFADNTGLQLEPLYTGKAMMALYDLLEADQLNPGSHVLFVHSGGLQGKRGFTKGVPQNT